MPRIAPLALALAMAALAACGGNGSQVADPMMGLQAREDQGQERTAQELYERARESMRRGDYRTAAERLENLQARYPFGPYSRQAQLDLIHAYFEAGEMGSAMSAADRFIRLNPQDEHVAYARYMRGRANLDRGNDFLTRTFDIDRRTRDPNANREAYADFQQVVERFPESRYAEDAERRMVKLRQDLAHYELYVAQYYMRRGAYVAAAERAQTVIENFQGTPSVREALGVLARAYGELELDDLQADVVRVIEANYPEHPVLREGVFSRGLGDASSGESGSGS